MGRVIPRLFQTRHTGWVVSNDTEALWLPKSHWGFCYLYRSLCTSERLSYCRLSRDYKKMLPIRPSRRADSHYSRLQQRLCHWSCVRLRRLLSICTAAYTPSPTDLSYSSPTDLPHNARFIMWKLRPWLFSLSKYTAQRQAKFQDGSIIQQLHLRPFWRPSPRVHRRCQNHCHHRRKLVCGYKPKNYKFTAVNHKGYFYAPFPGDYTFGIPKADGIAVLWIGPSARFNWTRTTAFLTQIIPPTLSNVYNATFAAGEYVEVRVVWGNGGGAGDFRMEVTGPAEVVLVYSSKESSFLLRFSAMMGRIPMLEWLGERVWVDSGYFCAVASRALKEKSDLWWCSWGCSTKSSLTASICVIHF